MPDFVTRNEQGTLVVAGSRITLGSIVKCFVEGESPEAIRDAYPSLSLESIYGAITHYLGNREAIDAELAEQDRATSNLRGEALQRNSDLRSRLLAAKASVQ